MRFVVLLRGVNVGGRNRLPMADLRGVLATVGGRDVRTYLQSGNAVLDAEPNRLAERVSAALSAQLGLDVVVLIRSADELSRVAAQNPFLERAASEPKLVHVAFLDEQPDPAVLDEVGRCHGGDEVAEGDRVLYLSYATGSRNSPLEKVLRQVAGTATTRNWSTVTALLSMAERSPSDRPGHLHRPAPL